MTEEDLPTTKPALLARINERWDALQALMGGLSDAEMENPLGDGWSAKVHLGHLAAWENSLLGLLQKRDRGAAMGVPADLWAKHDETATNGYIAARTEAQPLTEVRSHSVETHAALMAQLEAMSQEDLEKPYSEYAPGDPPYNAHPVGGWVHGNTWDHYNEHIGWLEAGLRAE